jgi:hypothetical protein
MSYAKLLLLNWLILVNGFSWNVENFGRRVKVRIWWTKGLVRIKAQKAQDSEYKDFGSHIKKINHDQPLSLCHLKI